MAEQRRVAPRPAVLAGAVLVAFLHTAAARAADCAGVTLPEQVRAGAVTLQLNGLGLREATLLGIDVYVAGLYLPRPERDAAAILAASAPRQIRLLLLRDVSSAAMATNIDASFRRAAGAALPRHAQSLQRLIALIPPLRKGDSFALTALPGSGVRIEHGARLLGTLPGDEFARTLFAIWLGEPPLSAPLKAGLLGKSSCGD